MGIALLTKKIKDNMAYFKDLLIKCFTSNDAEPKRERIKAIDGDIAELKEKLKEYVGKFDEYSTSMSSKIMDTISSLTLERMNLENELLIVGSAEERTKAVIAAFNKLPDKLEELNDIDYRKLYSRAFAKSKDDILLIVGNKDVTKLNLSTKGDLEIEIPYKVRITTYKLKLSVFVNI